MIFDRRLLKVSFDHSQRRVVKPRIGVAARGFDFLSGILNGMWVSPITGVLQSIPNSEEPDYTTSNAGRWAKFGTSDFSTVDQNASQGTFSTMAASGNANLPAVYYTPAAGNTGGNAAGVGAITTVALAQNTGLNLAQYVYGNGLDTDVLIEFGWGDSANYLSGTSVRVYLGGQIEVYHQGVLQGKGAFGGSGYQFGSAKGGFYSRPSDQYVQIRAEAYRDRYLLLTSSIGGVFQFACPWAVDQVGTDGVVTTPAAPILPAAKAWFRIPKGGCSVVWSKVQYAPSGTAVSETFALSEAPQDERGIGAFSGKAIPANSTVTVGLVAEDGVSAFNETQNRCRVRVQASSAPVWIDGTSTRYDPVAKNTTGSGTGGNGIDVTPYLRSRPSLSKEDGPEATFVLELAYDAPVTDLADIENRPIKIELVQNPLDNAPLPTICLLDGIGGVPAWIDGRGSGDGEDVEQSYIRIEVRSRLTLLKDVDVTETVVFDGSDFCKPTSVGDSFVSVCLRQAGIVPAASGAWALPNIDFKFDHVPPQRAGDWSFAGQPGDKWWDLLVRGFEMAEALIWGMRPTGNHPDDFYVIDSSDGPVSKATLYRSPDAAAGGGVPNDVALGCFPGLYDDHERNKLPREGNLVRVMGMDPATQKPIIQIRSDIPSRDPAGTIDGDWLGATRTVKYESETLTTLAMVDRVADALADAISQRDYVETWHSTLIFGADGLPLWRGDGVTLAAAQPDGDDSIVAISSLRAEFGDESGMGLADSTGAVAPMPIRTCDYSGGALVGLGGTGGAAIAARHKARLREGGWRGRATSRIPLISPAIAVVKSL